MLRKPPGGHISAPGSWAARWPCDPVTLWPCSELWSGVQPPVSQSCLLVCVCVCVAEPGGGNQLGRGTAVLGNYLLVLLPSFRVQRSYCKATREQVDFLRPTCPLHLGCWSVSDGPDAQGPGGAGQASAGLSPPRGSRAPAFVGNCWPLAGL